MANAQPTNPNTPWHSVYPTPAFDTQRMSPSALADLMRSKVAGVDYIVIDVRRTDFEVILHVNVDIRY
jgi:arsenical-resistance protein 2